MGWTRLVIAAAVVLPGVFLALPAPAQSVTAYEGARLIVGDGRVIEKAIVAATRNGAEYLRLPDAGTLQAGKSADFLVLDANPLDDITNTRRIATVVLRGATVDRSQPVR